MNEYYHHKCAYCEIGGGKADIEHYRPKGSVKEEPIHKGYYWLAYEWSNLIPSCKDCNREGGKKTMFPIAGTRVNMPVFLESGELDRQACLANSSSLLKEKPYLLHPEIDEPKQHLGFKVNSNNKGIDIIPTDLQNDSILISKGSETIRVCDLNREELQISRLTCIREKIYENLVITFKLREDNVISEKQLEILLKRQLDKYQKNASDEKTEHTLLWWYIMMSVENFKKIVFPNVKTTNKQLILEKVYLKYF